MFNFLLRILPDIKLPSQDTVEDKALRKEIGIQESDTQVISRWLGLVLLLRMPAGDKPWSPEMELPYRQISLTKTRVISLLSSSIFTDQEKFMPALYASSSPDSNVSSPGTNIIKKLNVNLEDEEIARRLWYRHYPTAFCLRDNWNLEQGYPFYLPAKAFSRSMAVPVSVRRDDSRDSR
ncbi:Proteasome-associated protein ECM29 -like protein [Ceratocystis lukuohia]|uniref:Proteasome-associated protein ECM29 -like protein n=1 Tax=Ceratocystis lukuohia TaxID=2019550 RepID=A0ABR4MFZ1_9PEZI